MLFSGLFKRKGEKKAESIDTSKILIREYTIHDKHCLFKVLQRAKEEYFERVYKACFKSIFTYATIGLLMSLSLFVLQNSIATLILPPLILTLFLLYRINKYKSSLPNFNIFAIENLVLSSSTIQRRKNQGAYICFYEDKLIAYCVYMKQRDELETVNLREFFVVPEYRRMRAATYILEYLCKCVFLKHGYKRLIFQLSNFNHEARSYCDKNVDTATKLYSWSAFRFAPAIKDTRTLYSIDFNKIL